VLVIGLTVLALAVLGAGRWRHIVAAWALLPALVAAGFLGVRIPRFVPEAERTRLRDLVRMPVYLAAVAAIGLAGATELAISQWLSSFAERGLGFHKTTGDLAGCGLFALAMAAGRLWMGLRGGQVCVPRVMAVSCWFSAGMYLAACFAPWPAVALAACALAGFGVSLLWPGMLTMVAARFPRGGASMFALLSAAGDLGCALAPWLVGAVADAALATRAAGSEQAALRAGLAWVAVCPLAMLVLLRRMPAAAQRDG
jgi:predicted MFS family arabinose efflux permease